MRLVTFDTGAGAEIGVLHGDLVVRPAAALRAHQVYRDGPATVSRAAELPEEMVAFFQTGAPGRALAAEAVALVDEHSARGDELHDNGRPVAHPVTDVRILAPVPRPPRVRDYLTYRAH
ncbi:fumarylacetoacetate hydrolase family protein, partial [Micromonospora sp. NPDC048830]